MQIKNRFTESVIFENDADTMRQTVIDALAGEADLREADLRGAYLRGANLRGATLRGANLYEADLRGVNLRGANLRGVNLRGANLRGANLREADLREADLYEADLREADLREADLYEADLRGVKDINILAAARLSILPAGEIIGWKKCKCGVIVKLEIGAKVRRSNATGRKCRAESAKVLEIVNSQGQKVDSAVSQHDDNFFYEVGKVVSVPNFDPDRWNECAPGIHFFITREEAEDY
jgi:uncharacterized protein YjbI with pentapeptide repeats